MFSYPSSTAAISSPHFANAEEKAKTASPVCLCPHPIAPSGVDLVEIINHPANQCRLKDLTHALTIRDISFECEGDGPIAQHPGFPGAVRQVIGSELIKTASREALAGLPCPWNPACGLHVEVAREI